MRKYIIRRLLTGIVIMIFVSFTVYAIMRSLPSSYIENIARERSMAVGAESYTECLRRLNEVYHLDIGIAEGYVRWLRNAVEGNFGESWLYNMPVIEKFNEVIWDSVGLGVISLVLEVVIAVPMGIITAKKRYGIMDNTMSVLSIIGISLPSFFVAAVLKLIFSVHLGWFDLYGKVGRYHDQMSRIGQISDIANHYVLPVITLTAVGVGFLMRYTRRNMIEVMDKDYIRAARAKGLSERAVINKHAFRNIMIPMITLLGGTLPSLFSGAMITETLFQIPGIGYTSYLALIKGDIPFSMFYVLFTAFMTLAGTLISDILYACVDPRVRVSK